MQIFLADLFHDNRKYSNPDATPQTIPLGIGYIGASLNQEMPDLEVKLFISVDDLLEAISKSQPSLVGFSMKSWNTDLTLRTANLIKEYSEDIPIVVGGPSIDDKDSEIRTFLLCHPQINYVVPSEGENGFIELVKNLPIGEKGDTRINGVAYLKSNESSQGCDDNILEDKFDNRKLCRGNYEPPSIADIPSPYLTGLLDPFLKRGLVPIIQTMRGCPYQCAFCVSGTTLWNKLRPFDLVRVKAELTYVMNNGLSKDLILTDENWGILKGRDVDLAKYLMSLNSRYGFPKRLYYYTAKVVTEDVHKITKLVAPIAWIGEFFMSYQTLNKDSRKEVKRVNTRLPKLKEATTTARNNGVKTVSEMIFGFPYETVVSIMDGVETLLSNGIDRILIYPLQLFPGMDLYPDSVREEYGFISKFRVPESGFGVYQDGNLAAAEVEEIVVGTRWSTFDDYLIFRRYSFFLMMFLGRSYFHELVQIGNAVGFNMPKLVRHLAMCDWSAHKRMARLLDGFTHEAISELHDTRDSVYEEVKSKLRRNEGMGGLKINLVYLGKIFSDEAALKEILFEVGEFIELESEKNGLDPEGITRYIREILPNRIILLTDSTDTLIKFSSTFNYVKWQKRNFEKGKDLLLSKPSMFVGKIDKGVLQALKKIKLDDNLSIQTFFDRTPNEKLVRRISTENTSA